MKHPHRGLETEALEKALAEIRKITAERDRLDAENQELADLLAKAEGRSNSWENEARSRRKERTELGREIRSLRDERDEARAEVARLRVELDKANSNRDGLSRDYWHLKRKTERLMASLKGIRICCTNRIARTPLEGNEGLHALAGEIYQEADAALSQ